MTKPRTETPTVQGLTKEDLDDLNLNLKFDLSSIDKNDLELLKAQLANDNHKITKTDLEQLREELRVDINKINQQDLINKQDLELLKQSVIKTQLELIEVNQKQLNELRQEHQAQLELAKNSQQYIVDQLAAAIIKQEKILEEKINVLRQLRPINLTEMTIPSTEVVVQPATEFKHVDQPVILTKEIDQLNPLTQTNIKIKPQEKIIPQIIDQELISDEVILNQPINDLNNLLKDIQVENQKFDQIKKLIKDQTIELSDIDSSYVLQEPVSVDLPKQELIKEHTQPKTNLANLKANNYQQVVQLNTPATFKEIKVDELKPEILSPNLIIDQRSVLLNDQLHDDKIDQLKQKYQEDKKLLELRQEESNAQIQVLNAQIDLLRKQLVKNQELNQSEIIKKTSEFKDVLQTQKVAYESILNQYKQQYENELVNSKNELIRLINEKIQAKTNEFLKSDDQESDFVQIRDTYLKVLNEQQKEYDKQIKQKQSEIIAKLNEQKDQLDDIIRLKNLE